MISWLPLLKGVQQLHMNIWPAYVLLKYLEKAIKIAHRVKRLHIDIHLHRADSTYDFGKLAAIAFPQNMSITLYVSPMSISVLLNTWSTLGRLNVVRSIVIEEFFTEDLLTEIVHRFQADGCDHKLCIKGNVNKESACYQVVQQYIR